ncbi:YhgE/Pip domain-containing protein [Dermatophilus congolensis]|uniref:YhgE/Pip domain-containing protein n=1 Tax=Dermatophilus congolensis TaxID=1863 RepID=UPI001AB00954|nr:YhgE/Pip domain-containing protein [Dermatophilus congolensis]MBO3129308.1 YhgE/Pip domain-containing protein [Dermatophilus congolensis]MBO3132060.1 YhgE/Pip domain-containing protein [Dermatophilus congolensis]MBO3133784.1 YhgE/Pip domain-containing protein [Dermatophilus congolensis]MBO3136015.1 YhgE/Pip domain-containing protein [Dermatophilus congolensis]MBO3138256.1 YhgE/Pip domain-containing protein [Dermatophilus congolensis]
MALLPTLSSSELRRISRGWFGKLVVIALLLIPSLYAGLLTYSNIDATNRLDNVPAAIVNKDEPATVTDANGKKQVVPLGRVVSGKLTGSDATNNLNWKLTDENDANDGLANGRYYAVLTIPKNFSAQATSSADPKKANNARLELNTNDATSYLSGNIAGAIATRITDSTSDELTKKYLDRVFLGFNGISEQMGKAADGAKKVQDGTQKLADGVVSAHKGTGTLDSGMGQLATGSQNLASGNKQLADGASKLADGASKLSDGAGKLATGLGEAKEKTAQLPEQTKQLADGSKKLATGLGTLDAGAKKLADGTNELAKGTAALPEQVGQLAQGATTFADGSKKLADGATRLGTGAQAVATGGSALAKGTTLLAGGASRLKTGVDRYTGGVDELASQCAASGASEAFCAQLNAISDQSGSIRSGAGRLAIGAAPLALGAERLQAGATRLAEGAAKYNAAVQQAGPGAARLADGLRKFAQSVPALSTGVQRIQEGANKLAQGTGPLHVGAEKLSGGLDQLAAGTPALTKGIADAANGAAAVSTGATSLQSGADKLSNGATSAAAGATKLAEGNSKAAKGVRDLHAGLGKLDDGARKLLQGATDLAKGLASGAKKIPTYDSKERNQLSAVVAKPVDGENVRLNRVANYGAGLAPYFCALGLWVGGMGLFFMLRPLPLRAMASTASPWRVALAGFAPAALVGIGQAVLLFTVMHWAVGITITNPGLFIGFAVLASCAFMAINQALVATLGPAGRFIGLLLIVLQLSSAGATYPIETAPGFFQFMHPLLPLTYAVQAFRSLIAGGTLHLAPAALVMLLWLIAALGMTVFTAARGRIWTVARLRDGAIA